MRKIKIEKPHKKKNGDAMFNTDLLSHFHTEIFGNKRLNFDGCLSVCDYNENYIKIRIKNGYLTVTGKGLDIALFEGRQLCIRGNILTLEFCLKE